MCAIEFDGDVACFRESEHASRKVRQCDACHAAIAIGERYVAHFAVYDGEPQSESMCLACAVDRKVFADAHGFAWCTPSSLVPLLDDCIVDDELPDITEEDLAWVAMRKRIRERASGATP